MKNMDSCDALTWLLFPLRLNWAKTKSCLCQCQDMKAYALSQVCWLQQVWEPRNNKEWVVLTAWQELSTKRTVDIYAINVQNCAVSITATQISSEVLGEQQAQNNKNSERFLVQKLIMCPEAICKNHQYRDTEINHNTLNMYSIAPTKFEKTQYCYICIFAVLLEITEVKINHFWTTLLDLIRSFNLIFFVILPWGM